MGIYGQYLVLISFFLQQIEFRNYIVEAFFKVYCSKNDSFGGVQPTATIQVRN